VLGDLGQISLDDMHRGEGVSLQCLDEGGEGCCVRVEFLGLVMRWTGGGRVRVRVRMGV
jgi:hypothetical protein